MRTREREREDREHKLSLMSRPEGYRRRAAGMARMPGYRIENADEGARVQFIAMASQFSVPPLSLSLSLPPFFPFLFPPSTTLSRFFMQRRFLAKARLLFGLLRTYTHRSITTYPVVHRPRIERRSQSFLLHLIDRKSSSARGCFAVNSRCILCARGEVRNLAREARRAAL